MDIKVVSQRNLCPELGWLDIRCDRSSVLGNPFDMGKDEQLREPVIKAYREWLWANIQLYQDNRGSGRVNLARWKNLRVATAAFKNPSANDVVKELQRIAGLVKAGKKVRLLCWCKQENKEVACHADIVMNCLIWILNNQAA